ncbi:hypothetical protein [Marinifilum sp. D737]|nr:hypothetical protein [Marinifilum sp. D737]MCY1635036.1 hypothetical protein [Marinifilum sp. D737]
MKVFYLIWVIIYQLQPQVAKGRSPKTLASGYRPQPLLDTYNQLLAVDL